jgi:diguanylate cyclase (GGDEF)-like protein
MIIYIVDDNQVNLEVLAGLIDQAGIEAEVDAYDDPLAALAAGAGRLPDIVLVDVMMPAIDGREFVRRFRNLPGAKHVLVVMVTAATDRAVRHSALELGVTDFLTKPLDPYEVICRLRNLASLRSSFVALQDRGRWLAEEVRKATRDIMERKADLRICLGVAEAVNQNATLDEVLRFAIDEVGRHLASACWRVEIFDTDSRGARALLSRECDDLADLMGLSGIRSALADSVRETASHSSITSTADYAGCAVMQAATAQGLGHALAFPILVERDVAAVAQLFWRLPPRLDDPAREVLAQVAHQLGRALERERWKRRLVHLATHDGLTGLANRAMLMRRLDEALTFADGETAMLFVDLDDFKQVNDTFGHGAGDDLLVAVARRLRDVAAACRSRAVTVARVGGDEFVVLVEGSGADRAIADMADQVHVALAGPHDIAGRTRIVTASIGYTARIEGRVDGDALLHQADLAMYEAKRNGKSGSVVFDEALRRELSARATLEAELRAAARTLDFTLQFQPMYTLSGRKLVGFEALLRWSGGSGQPIGPATFVPMLEEMGSIVQVGAWVLRTACQTVADWAARLGGVQPLFVCVNVSATQIASPGFEDMVVDALERTGLAPASLRLELTEAAALSDVDRAIAVLASLRSLGVKISLDDFGTGFSSLSYLQRLPLDTLKIDRSFVSGAAATGDRHIIVRSIMAIADEMGMDVVAEGIESEEQMLRLLSAGCSVGQGYLFSRPLDRDAAEALVRTAQTAFA